MTAGPGACRVTPNPSPAKILALFLFLSTSLLFSISCGDEKQQPVSSSQDKIGYIARSVTGSRLMLTTLAGGEGQSLLQWPGEGERFSFSNDGRFFSLVLSRKSYAETDPNGSDLHHLYASTNGERAYLSNVPANFSFSPDSKQIAYISYPVNGINELGILDIESGASKTLSRGSTMTNPTWINDSTIIYTRLNDPASISNLNGGIIYRQNIDSSVATQLTPGDRSFSTYHAPVSFSTSKIILMQRETLNNLWSLDVDSGRLRQITNNNLFQFRAGYLPGGNKILFEEQNNPQNTTSSELCMISDDGTDFKMYTSNYSFDGLNSFSLDGQKFVYQQTDLNNTSIWSINQDGSGQTRITGSDTFWLGDPNFVPVPDWQATNPLEMAVSDSGLDEPLVVSIRNTSNGAVESVLRAFSGTDLLLTSAGGGNEPVQTLSGADPGGTASTNRTEPKLAWRIKLEPGGSTEIKISTKTMPVTASSREASLLLTLAVPGTPPRMYWQAFK